MGLVKQCLEQEVGAPSWFQKINSDNGFWREDGLCGVSLQTLPDGAFCETGACTNDIYENQSPDTLTHPWTSCFPIARKLKFDVMSAYGSLIKTTF